MAEIVCEGCGHHFPQKAKEGTVACSHCGRPTHIPGAIVCPECDHLNQDVSYCVACGAALFKGCPECDARMEVDQKACGECGAIYADCDLDPEKKDQRTLPHKLWKFPAFSLTQLAVVLFLASLIVYNFAHEVMIGPAYLEGIFLWAGVGIVALLALWKLARRRPFALLVIGVVIVLMIKGCGLAG